MKKLFVASALALSIALASPGCTTTQVADSAATANALLGLNLSYQTAKASLNEELGRFPEDVQVQLKELEAETDQLVVEAEALWKSQPLLTVVAWDLYYQRAKVIYFKGKNLITPYKDNLSEETKLVLADIKTKAAAIDAQYSKLKSGQTDVISQQEMLRAGMELATLALQIGVKL